MKIKRVFCLLLSLFFLSGCSNNTTSETKYDSDIKPKTKLITLTTDNVEDFLRVEYTSSVSDCYYNEFMKTVRYRVNISSYDEEYIFKDVEIKIGNSTYEVDSNGNVDQITFSKDVADLDEVFVVPPVKIKEVDGEVSVPNKTFTISMYVDGEVVETQTISYGLTPEITYIPTKEGYYFHRWSKTLTRVKKDVSIHAEFLKEITITYMVNDKVYKTMKYGKGMTLGEANDLYLSSDEEATFTYWYEDDYREPYNFEKILEDDLILNALYREEKYCHGAGDGYVWNLSSVNVKNCVVPRTYGSKFGFVINSSGNQEIKIKTSSSNLGLDSALIIAINGDYHNQITGAPTITPIGKGVDVNNDPYLTVRTTEDGLYYFYCISKMSVSFDILFDMQIEISNIF